MTEAEKIALEFFPKPLAERIAEERGEPYESITRDRRMRLQRVLEPEATFGTFHLWKSITPAAYGMKRRQYKIIWPVNYQLQKWLGKQYHLSVVYFSWHWPDVKLWVEEVEKYTPPFDHGKKRIKKYKKKPVKRK